MVVATGTLEHILSLKEAEGARVLRPYLNEGPELWSDADRANQWTLIHSSEHGPMMVRRDPPDPEFYGASC